MNDTINKNEKPINPLLRSKSKIINLNKPGRLESLNPEYTVFTTHLVSKTDDYRLLPKFNFTLRNWNFLASRKNPNLNSLRKSKHDELLVQHFSQDTVKYYLRIRLLDES